MCHTVLCVSVTSSLLYIEIIHVFIQVFFWRSVWDALICVTGMDLPALLCARMQSACALLLRVALSGENEGLHICLEQPSLVLESAGPHHLFDVSLLWFMWCQSTGLSRTLYLSEILLSKNITDKNLAAKRLKITMCACISALGSLCLFVSSFYLSSPSTTTAPWYSVRQQYRHLKQHTVLSRVF